MTKIDYFMTLNSPWAYLGSRRLIEIAKAKGATIDLKPTKFGPVFEVTGGLPLPKRAPARRAYRLMELDRWRKFRNRPLVLEPKYFPANEAPGTRMILRAKLAGLDAVRLSSEIGCALWEMEQDIAQPEVLAAAAARAGIDAAKIPAGPGDTELDAINDGFTQEAILRGVFGAPTYMLPSGEFFWGQDRLDFLERAL
ncbi:MAG: 2-hydroxychromene-2-carboxylate isomerase [Hyphomicrobiaceae bacterium]